MSAIEAAESVLPHLQKAALELIAAARAFLDVAEEAVRDPAEVAEVLNGLATLLGGGRPAASEKPGGEPEPGADGDPRGARRRKIERIQVS